MKMKRRLASRRTQSAAQVSYVSTNWATKRRKGKATNSTVSGPALGRQLETLGGASGLAGCVCGREEKEKGQESTLESGLVKFGRQIPKLVSRQLIENRVHACIQVCFS